ncbi:hypothetical protein D9M70_614290 [compost metagenome]
MLVEPGHRLGVVLPEGAQTVGGRDGVVLLVALFAQQTVGPMNGVDHLVNESVGQVLGALPFADADHLAADVHVAEFAALERRDDLHVEPVAAHAHALREGLVGFTHL